MQNLSAAVKAGDVEEIKKIMAEHDLIVYSGRIVPRDTVAKAKLAAVSAYWDQCQQAR